MILTENAYGKINLFLDLTGIRDDGYHEIYTVMQSVSLSDTVTLEIIPSETFSVSLQCHNSEIGCGDENLIIRAAKSVASRYSDIRGIHRFTLEKNIPVAAGMAGGSADAAATLRLMNRAHALALSTEQLREIGVTLGADVPFCICGGTCLCEGIGEKISELPSPSPFYAVIAIGASSISTPAAFRALDAKLSPAYYAEHAHMTITKDNLRDVYTCADVLYNLFEEVILPIDPHARTIKKILEENGALGALMSGSGPSVFGIFSSREQAVAVVDTLTRKGYRAHLCRTVQNYA
ncbi:MAG: 4-(cytidine 5'-diphospho)-2-C-methyl-D-erythritol kinase [Clostridia bacterium]|nr:4-(cytidine 5'-diphospho)-2-C-methyl-D-erythritol kinase [Clostridia bacterium]